MSTHSSPRRTDPRARSPYGRAGHARRAAVRGRLAADEDPSDQGARLLQLDPGLADVARIVRQHHERYDGSGYPDGRTGADTTIEARIISVCDAWAAMRVDRPYQPARTVAQARAELHRCAGSQFDPDVVDAFLTVLDHGRIDEIADTDGGQPRHADLHLALDAG